MRRALTLLSLLAALATLSACGGTTHGPAAPPVPKVDPEPGPNPVARMRLAVPARSEAAAAARAAHGSAALALRRIAREPVAQWVGTGGDPVPEVRRALADARRRHAAPVLVLYHLPHHDCSRGGPSAAAYRAAVGRIAALLEHRSAVVILEPNALVELPCLPRAARAERLALLRDAGQRLGALPHVATYLAAGDAHTADAATVAERLRAAGLEAIRGFALNVAGFDSTAAETRYGRVVSALTGGKHFVIDTARNGAPIAADEGTCNPPSARLGEAPGTATHDAFADAYLWIKPPGESDGPCHGAPPGGTFSPALAVRLARSAGPRG